MSLWWRAVDLMLSRSTKVCGTVGWEDSGRPIHRTLAERTRFPEMHCGVRPSTSGRPGSVTVLLDRHTRAPVVAERRSRVSIGIRGAEVRPYGFGRPGVEWPGVVGLVCGGPGGGDHRRPAYPSLLGLSLACLSLVCLFLACLSLACLSLACLSLACLFLACLSLTCPSRAAGQFGRPARGPQAPQTDEVSTVRRWGPAAVARARPTCRAGCHRPAGRPSPASDAPAAHQDMHGDSRHDGAEEHQSGPPPRRKMRHSVINPFTISDSRVRFSASTWLADPRPGWPIPSAWRNGPAAVRLAGEP